MPDDNRSLAITPNDVDVPQQAIARGISYAQWNALKKAIYHGASDEMMLLAIDYCRARGLDPIKKPVHIVPTWSEKQGKMIETIWEGINSIRTTAARTGEYAGIDDPVFGPDVTRAVGSAQMTYPQWCKITVYKLVKGQRFAFTGMCRWTETYSKGKDKITPNTMWQRRPYSQLVKCTEAETLRKAFPEEVGGREIADESGIFESDHSDVTRDEPKKSRLDVLEENIVTHSVDTETGEVTSNDEMWNIGLEKPSEDAKFKLVRTHPEKQTRYFTFGGWCKVIRELVAAAPDKSALWQENMIGHAYLTKNMQEEKSQKELKKIAELFW